MHQKIINNARPIAWMLLGAYFLIMATGMAFETAAGSFFSGTGLWVSIVEVSVMTAWAVVGALLVLRQPAHPIGWIWLSISIIVALDHLSWGYAYYGLFTNPGSLPGAELMVIWNYWTGRTIALIPLTLLFLLFPTGRPLYSRWAWLSRVAIGALVVHIPIAAMAPNPVAYFPFPLDVLGASPSLRALARPLWWITGFIPVVCALLATVSLIIRLQRSRGVERQQLKWFAYAAAFFMPGAFLIIVSGIQEALSQDLLFTTGVVLTLIAITGMSVASAIAILRYRLWDIDILIRRTLIYGTLTLILALIYFSLVTLLQTLVSAATGQRSTATVVASTLVIAALFNPGRSRIQDLIDRRFYRQKYDAEQALARFSLIARDELELESLSRAMLVVVDDTFQPEFLSLWLRETLQPMPGTK